MGIKSAGVHYYFPTKADPGAELAAQYTGAFAAVLREPGSRGDNNTNPVLRYIFAGRRMLISNAMQDFELFEAGVVDIVGEYK